MTKINQTLLANKAIFLNLTPQERTLGLDEIVEEWLTFFGLKTFFWNIALKDYVCLTHPKEKREVAVSMGNNFHQEDNSQSLEAIISQAVKENNQQKSNRASDHPKRRASDYHTDNHEQKFEDILKILVKTYNNNAPGIYLIENIVPLLSDDRLTPFEEQQIQTWLLKICAKYHNQENFYLVLLDTQEDKEWHLESTIPKVKLPFLELAEITNLLNQKFAQLRLKDAEKPYLVSQAAHILLGLTKPELIWGINKIANSLDADRSVSFYLDQLLEYKIERLRNIGLEFLPLPETDEVGGMDLLKAGIFQVADEFAPEARLDNIPVPKGWMLAGVPGSGKSYVAKCMQIYLKLPMIYLSVDGVLSKGELHLSSVLKRVEACAPNIVYFDEFDKLFPKVKDSKTTKTSAVLLTWLQEKQAHSFALATLNRLDALPPEMTRAGRFDKIWYVGFPQPIERLEIFKVHLKRFDHRFRRGYEFTRKEWASLLTKTINFTGAEIANVCQIAAQAKYQIKIAKIKEINQSITKIQKLVSEWIKPQHYQNYQYEYMQNFSLIAKDVASNPEIQIIGNHRDILQEIKKINNLQEQLKLAREERIEIDLATLIACAKKEIPVYRRDPEGVMAIENIAKDVCIPVSSKDESQLIPNDGTFWPEIPKKYPQQSKNTVLQVVPQSSDVIVEVLDDEDDDSQIYGAFG